MDHDRFSRSPFNPASRLNDAVTPYPLTLRAAAPNLVACPIHPAMMTAVQDIYRIAYENAVAAARTSRYGPAMMASPN